MISKTINCTHDLSGRHFEQDSISVGSNKIPPFIYSPSISHKTRTVICLIIQLPFQCLLPSTRSKISLPAKIQTQRLDPWTAHSIECSKIKRFCSPSFRITTTHYRDFQMERRLCSNRTYLMQRTLLVRANKASVLWSHTLSKSWPLYRRYHVNSPSNSVSRRKL